MNVPEVGTPSAAVGRTLAVGHTPAEAVGGNSPVKTNVSALFEESRRSSSNSRPVHLGALLGLSMSSVGDITVKQTGGKGEHTLRRVVLLLLAAVYQVRG